MLAIASWFVLSPIWNWSAPGSLTDRVVGGILIPGAKAGVYLAKRVYPPTTVRYALPLAGAVGEVIFLAVIWFIVIQIVGHGKIAWGRAQTHE